MTATIASLGVRVLRRLGVAVVAAADRPALTATITVAVIATRALEWLGVAASDETPVASDTTLAQAKVNAIHDGLVAQGIASWASTAIPQSVSEDYVMLTALHLASSFGKAGDPAQEAAREAHIRRVAQLMTAPAIAEQAVLDVHANLDARGKTRWGCSSVPDYIEPFYVEMAATLVAPTFGIQPDPQAWARGEKAINQMIALASSGQPVRANYF